MEDLGSEIAAEEAPEWAIRGRADVVLIAGDDIADRKGGWTVGEESTVKDKGIVGNGVIGDENDWAEADWEGEDRAILGNEASEERFDVEGGCSKP